VILFDVALDELDGEGSLLNEALDVGIVDGEIRITR
jgi:hypothetical protein